MIASSNVILLDGFWRASLRTDGPASGICFLALRDGVIVGADFAYHFRGHYSVNGTEAVATVVSQHYAGPKESLWGWRDGAELELRGSADVSLMELAGHFIGEPGDGITRVYLQKLASWDV